MSNTLQAIHLLKDKLELLISKYSSLKEENELLITQNSKLQTELQRKKQQLLEKEDELKSIKVAKTIAGTSKNIKDTKLKINTLIREIDTCIIQLNS